MRKAGVARGIEKLAEFEGDLPMSLPGHFSAASILTKVNPIQNSLALDLK
jgi:hypothetical protein